MLSSEGILSIADSTFVRNYAAKAGVMMIGTLGSVICNNCTFSANFALESGVFDMNNATTNIFTRSSFVDNTAINSPIGSSTSSSVVFNNTLIEANVAISADKFFREAFACEDFCYLTEEFKESMMKNYNKSIISTSSAEI